VSHETKTRSSIHSLLSHHNVSGMHAQRRLLTPWLLSVFSYSDVFAGVGWVECVNRRECSTITTATPRDDDGLMTTGRCNDNNGSKMNATSKLRGAAEVGRNNATKVLRCAPKVEEDFGYIFTRLTPTLMHQNCRSGVNKARLLLKVL
jgi:hypothetical protein